MSLAALLFDVDGTLADTEEAHRRAFNAAFAEHGLVWEWSESEYARLLKVAGGAERIAHFIDRLGVPAGRNAELKGRVPAIHQSKTRRYGELIAGGAAPLRAGVERLLVDARAAGLKLAIATTTTPANVEVLLASALGSRSLEWFDVLACGDSVAHKKPAPDIYLLALGRLGLAPWCCAAFEDSANGLAAARAAGLYTVVTPTRWTAGEDLTAAERRVGDLSELGGLAGLRAGHASWLARRRRAA